MKAGKRRRTWKLTLVRAIVFPFILLGVTELMVRAATHILFTWGEWGTAIVDPVVGRLPRPGLILWDPGQWYRISIGDYSTRSNGRSPPRSERPLTLVVGDSFAFGEDVGDEDSWPALLQRLTDKRVINGGVPGFGLDQTVLRAEQLAEIYSPDTIIVSFIANDVQRCEMSCHSGHVKPYFDIDPSGLRLYPAPTPDRPLLKRLLSPSIVLDILLDKAIMWDGPDSNITVHQRGKEVACLLMQRLAALGRARGARIIVVAQIQAPNWSSEDLEIKDTVLACAEANQLDTRDLFPIASELSEQEREALFAGSGHGHMNASGNRLVAAELARHP